VQKIKLKRKTDGKEVECTVEILDGKSLKKIVELEKNIVENLPSRDLFQDDTDDLILDFLGRRGLAYGVINEDNLIACSALYFPGEREENLGIDIGLEEDLQTVVHLETIMVHPDYRGNGLQKILAEILIKEAKNRGFKHVLATVSPKNTVSYTNFEKLGFKKITTKIKFGDKLRDIMYMKI